jgi:hypothetical protein
MGWLLRVEPSFLAVIPCVAEALSGVYSIEVTPSGAFSKLVLFLWGAALICVMPWFPAIETFPFLASTASKLFRSALDFAEFHRHRAVWIGIFSFLRVLSRMSSETSSFLLKFSLEKSIIDFDRRFDHGREVVWRVFLSGNLILDVVLKPVVIGCGQGFFSPVEVGTDSLKVCRIICC